MDDTRKTTHAASSGPIPPEPVQTGAPGAGNGGPDVTKRKPRFSRKAKRALVIALGAIGVLGAWFWPRSMGYDGENTLCLGYAYLASEVRYASKGDIYEFGLGSEYLPYGSIGESMPDYCFGVPFFER